MDMLALTGMAGSLNAAYTAVKNLMGMKVQADVLAQVNALQSAIFDAQSQAMQALQAQQALEDDLRTAKEETRRVKEELARLSRHHADLEHYELRDLGGGAFVYSLKRGAEGASASHWLCVPCADAGKKSILQLQGVDPASYGKLMHYACPTCSTGVRPPRTNSSPL